MPIQETCSVAEAVRLNDYAYSFTLEAPGIAAAIAGPGQFVHIKCGHSRLLRRPISICDWEEGLVRVVFEVRGDGTAWLARRAVGDKLDVLGPLGSGFRLAVCGADRAVVVSTNDSSALRDAQRTVVELGRRLDTIHLVMNRIQPKLLRQLRTTIDDAMDAAGLPLIGVVPEDPRVILSANQGRPLILGGRQGAANACLNIAKRIQGLRVPIMRIR